MYSSNIFIISKRKELSIKHKRLIEALGHVVIVINSPEDAFLQIKEKEPELIIISDTICKDFSQFIKQIRVLTYNFRPAIVAISKSSELSDKLAILDAGADDYLGEEIAPSEFQARIRAHLRRYLENSIHLSTNFVEKDLTVKTIKRALLSEKKSSIALIEISGINFYKEIYGEIAYEKVLQTLGALINSTLSNEDFIGHYSKKEFILVTSPQKVEKVVSFLTFAFDNILERFYSELDFKNKFVKFFSDEKIENKIPMMKLSVGVIEVEKGKFENYKMVLNSLFAILKLCKSSDNSCYIIDRPKIKGEVKAPETRNRVLIIEQDEALSYLLQTTCELKGLNSKILENGENFDKIYDKFKPDVVIIDFQEYRKTIQQNETGKTEGLEICEKIKQKKDNGDSVKIIFSSSLHKKREILSAGADLYLPKPYDVKVLFSWVEKFLNN